MPLNCPKGYGICWTCPTWCDMPVPLSPCPPNVVPAGCRPVEGRDGPITVRGFVDGSGTLHIQEVHSEGDSR